MSSESQELSLADICSDVSYGYTESATDEQVGPKFLRITDIQGGTFDWDTVPYCPATDANVIKYRLVIGDIVVARTGNSTGENAQITKEPPSAVFASYLIRFRPDAEHVNPFFVGYQLRSDRFRQHVLAVRGGSAQPGANAKQLGAFPIRLIPRLLQDSAVEILRSIDDRIALLRETNATLEAIAQAMFKSWFVDFDPIHAKQQDRAPEGMSEATPARSTPGGAPGVPPDPSAATALFPDSFEESELGLVPRGWKIGKVSDFAKQHKGSINPLKNPGTLYEHFSLPAFDSQHMPVLELGTEIKSNKTSVPPDAVCSTEFLVFVPAGGASKEFIYCAFTTPKFKELLCQLVTGTSNSHQRVKPDGVSSISAVLSPPEVLEVFADVVKPMFERIGHNLGKAQTLATLRDTLLPRLISGQLRLPEAEAVLEKVAG